MSSNIESVRAFAVEWRDFWEQRTADGLPTRAAADLALARARAYAGVVAKIDSLPAEPAPKPAPPANLESLRHRITESRDRAHLSRPIAPRPAFNDGAAHAYDFVLNLIDQYDAPAPRFAYQTITIDDECIAPTKVNWERRYNQQSRILRERNDEIGALKLSLRRTTTSRNAALEAMGTKDTVIYDKDREIARLKKCQLNQRDTINLLRDQIAGTQNVLRTSCAAAEETLRKVGVPADHAITSLMEAD